MTRFQLIGGFMLCFLCERAKNERVVRAGNGGGLGGDAKKKWLYSVHLPNKLATTPVYTSLISCRCLIGQSPILLMFCSLIAQGKEEIPTQLVDSHLQLSWPYRVENERAVTCCLLRGDFCLQLPTVSVSNTFTEHADMFPGVGSRPMGFARSTT